MRAVWVGLVGAVLVAGGAQAGVCTSGSVRLIEQPNENRPGDLMTVNLTGFAKVRRATPDGPYQAYAARGTANGTDVVVEYVSAPHMLGSPVSHGMPYSLDGRKPIWKADHRDLPWSDNDLLGVASGPLQGPWRVKCN